MCRLLGWVSDQPRALAELLSAGDLAEFTELSRHHADGWGISWYDADGELQTLRSQGAAYQDDAYSEAVSGIRSTAALLHLRWATMGIAVQPGNTHPFVRDGCAFAHNGSIWPRDGLLDLLDAVPDDLRGDSDSELYLLVLLQRVAKLGFDDGLRETITAITEDLTPSSLNAMLLADGELTAMSCNVGDAGCPADPGPDPTPELLPGYYDLRVRHLDGATLVASSGWADDAAWDRVENGTALVLTPGGPARSVPIGRYPEAAEIRATKKRFGGEL